MANLDVPTRLCSSLFHVGSHCTHLVFLIVKKVSLMPLHNRTVQQKKYLQKKIMCSVYFKMTYTYTDDLPF